VLIDVSAQRVDVDGVTASDAEALEGVALTGFHVFLDQREDRAGGDGLPVDLAHLTGLSAKSGGEYGVGRVLREHV